ncbi:hypothetical protein LXL04_006986 [Taraxacum kok-saghyz]
MLNLGIRVFPLPHEARWPQLPFGELILNVEFLRNKNDVHSQRDYEMKWALKMEEIPTFVEFVSKVVTIEKDVTGYCTRYNPTSQGSREFEDSIEAAIDHCKKFQQIMSWFRVNSRNDAVIAGSATVVGDANQIYSATDDRRHHTHRTPYHLRTIDIREYT